MRHSVSEHAAYASDSSVSWNFHTIQIRTQTLNPVNSFPNSVEFITALVFRCYVSFSRSAWQKKSWLLFKDKVVDCNRCWKSRATRAWIWWWQLIEFTCLNFGVVNKMERGLLKNWKISRFVWCNIQHVTCQRVCWCMIWLKVCDVMKSK